MLKAQQQARFGSQRQAAAAALAGLALVLAGCGGDDGDGSTTAVGDSAEMPKDEASEAEDAAEDGAAEDATAGEDTKTGEDSDEPELAAGVYREYSEDAVADPGFDTTIIFFHASWCPECQDFDKSIKADDIPDGVQILKTDYDTADDLKRQYEVTIQTTFVKVDPAGEELAMWVGYEKDRSVETILRELG